VVMSNARECTATSVLRVMTLSPRAIDRTITWYSGLTALTPCLSLLPFRKKEKVIHGGQLLLLVLPIAVLVQAPVD
jgi:hypothetical protein